MGLGPCPLLGQLWGSVPARLIIVIRTWSSFQLLFGAVKGLAVAVTYMLALLAPCPSGLSLLINFLFLKGLCFSSVDLLLKELASSD